MSRKHMGSGIDDFLKQEGIFDEAQAQAVKEVVAWQLAEAMRKRKFPKHVWPRSSRRAAARLIASWTPRTTLHCQAFSARLR